ncbi:threonine aldolase family protein [Fusibacter sp. JL298sf-3]
MIDLRSDTLTLPSSDMLETILHAKLGDASRLDAQGCGEDAAVNEIEAFAAQLTGKERALLFPSGTLANTAAILTHCKPGDTVLLDDRQHIYLSEKAAFSEAFGQLNPLFYNLNDENKPSLNTIKRLLEEKSVQLICVENTHNFTGGVCMTLEELSALSQLARHHGVPIHMDGARVFNAAAGLGVEVHEICQHVDSVMFCLSKGLGAPMGSMLCGGRVFIKKVLEKKKQLGGNMRQAGVIAAPGLYALKANRAQLKVDNSHAKRVWERLKALKVIVPPERVDSNIVMLDMSGAPISPEKFCEMAYDKGLWVRPILETCVRLVFYNAIDLEQAEEAAAIILSIDDALYNL